MAGVLSLKTPSTGLVTLTPTDTATDKTITLPATTGTVVIQDGTSTATVVNLTATGTVNVGGGNISPQTGFKNRIINGAMTIDQRNAGASVSAGYPVDRYSMLATLASKFTMQQNSGGVTPPNGYINYLGAVSSSAYSVLIGDTFGFNQVIEGFNIADLNWGTASAETVTVSFWARSSLTGTFGGALTNSAANRSYPFSYAISSANTWEYKTITITGDTSGTWLKDNGIGVYVRFGLGSGATYSGTSDAWQAGNLVQPTGTVSVVGTSGATFYITGVQLEKGTVATPFEFRSIGTELALCQRYFFAINASGSAYGKFLQGLFTSSTQFYGYVSFPTTMRTTPSLSTSGSFSTYEGATTLSASSIVGDQATNQGTGVVATVSGATAQRPAFFQAQASGSSQINFSAEL